MNNISSINKKQISQNFQAKKEEKNRRKYKSRNKGRYLF